jgi:alpha-tubulin suppressor-like RCC1 family protein
MTILEPGNVFSCGAIISCPTDSTKASSSALDRTLAKHRVKQVACGALHAAILSEDGHVYTWGCGDGGYTI